MKICNVVATATLKSKLNLELMHDRLTGSEFSKSTGHWLKYRLPSDNRYVAFYKSGKFLMTGSGVLEDLDGIVASIIDVIRSTGEDAEIIRVDINNIVCKDQINLKKSLETVYSSLESDTIEYEPEQFPALIYKNWGLSFLLFSTGSLIITGAKDVNAARHGLQQFKEILKNI